MRGGKDTRRGQLRKDMEQGQENDPAELTHFSIVAAQVWVPLLHSSMSTQTPKVFLSYPEEQGHEKRRITGNTLPTALKRCRKEGGRG